MILSMSMKGSVRARVDTRVSVLDLDNSVRFSSGYVETSEEAPGNNAFHRSGTKLRSDPHSGDQTVLIVTLRLLSK